MTDRLYRDRYEAWVNLAEAIGDVAYVWQENDYYREGIALERLHRAHDALAALGIREVPGKRLRPRWSDRKIEKVIP